MSLGGATFHFCFFGSTDYRSEEAQRATPVNVLRTTEMTTKYSQTTQSLWLFFSLFHKINEVNTESTFNRFLGHNIPAEYNSIKCTVATEK